MSYAVPGTKGVSGSGGWLTLLAIATAVDGLLAGASLDQSIKQLPARHQIGMRAFSAYSRAADQANGLLLYVLLGVGGAVLTLAVAGWSLALALPAAQTLPVLLAGGLAIAHTLTTARAAPINWSQRAVAGDEGALALVFRRFELWQSARAVLQLLTFAVMIWALVLNARGVMSG
jgi:hypothetical protein